MPKVITPDLCDEFSEHLQVLNSNLKHYGGRTDFYGQVTTVACFEDNSKVGQILRNENGNHGVLVVDGGASSRRALLGDMIAEAAVKNKWAGIIINGYLRDVEIIKTLPIGVMALGSVPLKTHKRDLGDVNVTLNIFGVSIRPNDFIYADETGVVVSPKNLFKE